VTPTGGYTLTTRKGKEISERKRLPLSRRRFAALIAIIVIIVSSVSIVSFTLLKPSPIAFSMNAAIIDQLATDFPNPQFVENATSLLKDHGFNVTYYNETLTVDFFKELAQKNYGIIMLRVHTALREDNKAVDIFTSERFSSSAYREEQNNGQLVKGVLNSSLGVQKEYFAITSKFIENLGGSFPKSIILAMGCWSLKSGCEQLAKTFISKGARAYIGWTDLVLPQDTDNENIKLLKLLLENNTIDYCLSRTRSHTYFVNNQRITTQLASYPSSSISLRLSDLINETKTSAP
jgi:hypothetical protein